MSAGPATVGRSELAPGYTISRVIKGGWQLAGGHGTVDAAAALADMQAFVDAGITTFDCADIYTGVEALIGEFLRERPPGSVQVHTKCVPDLGRLGDLTAAEIEALVDRSRRRLGVEVIDLVQFHWWDYALGDCRAALDVLLRLRSRGVIRHVGLTNFSAAWLDALLDEGYAIASHQVQYSLLDRRPAARMAGRAAAGGVGLLCYGALAGGFLGRRWLGRAEPTEPLENRSLTKYKLIIDDCGGWDRFQALLELLDGIAGRHGVGLGAVAVAWVLAQPGVSAVIVGARDRAHLGDTVAGATLVLAPADRAAIEGFLAESPMPPGDVYDAERDREGRHGRIMRYNLNTSG